MRKNFPVFFDLPLALRWFRCYINKHCIWAPVAQLDRASASGVEGRGFESRRVYHSSKIPVKNSKTAFASKLARRFFYFLRIRLLTHPGDFGGGLPALCAGSLRFARVESRRVYHLSKIPVKKRKAVFANKFADCFSFFLLFFGCFAPAGLTHRLPSLCSGFPRDFLCGLPSRCSGFPRA